jgi:hypothetical protein
VRYSPVGLGLELGLGRGTIGGKLIDGSTGGGSRLGVGASVSEGVEACVSEGVGGTTVDVATGGRPPLGMQAASITKATSAAANRLTIHLDRTFGA